MVMFAGTPGGPDHRRPGSREFSGDTPDIPRRHTRDLRDRLGCVIGNVLFQKLEYGPDAGSFAIGQADGVPAFELRVLVVLQFQGHYLGTPGTGGDRLAAIDRIPEIELVLGAVFLHIAFTEEALIIGPHQERKVGLLLDVRRVVKIFFQNDMHHAQRQRCIRANTDIQPAVRVRRRGAEIGCYGNDFRPAVSRLPNEMRIRDASVVRIADPDQNIVGQEPVVGSPFAHVRAPALNEAHGQITHTGPRIDVSGVESVAEQITLGGRADTVVDIGRALIIKNAFGTMFHDHVENSLGDLLGGLVPRNALPLPRASFAGALQRVTDAGGIVHLDRIRTATRTTPRVEIGDVFERFRVVRVLFLPPDYAILDISIERARGNAIGSQVRDMYDLIPGPLLPINILPVPVLVGF